MAVGDRSRPNSSLTYEVLLTLLPLCCAEESGVASADSKIRGASGLGWIAWCLRGVRRKRQRSTRDLEEAGRKTGTNTVSSVGNRAPLALAAQVETKRQRWSSQR